MRLQPVIQLIPSEELTFLLMCQGILSSNMVDSQNVWVGDSTMAALISTIGRKGKLLISSLPSTVGIFSTLRSLVVPVSILSLFSVFWVILVALSRSSHNFSLMLFVIAILASSVTFQVVRMRLSPQLCAFGWGHTRSIP